MADDVWPPSTAPIATTIGSYRFGVTGFFGFDERKPKSKSKGTSDVLGTGWNDLLVRDFDSDNTVDLVARETASNTPYLYPGNGSGGFGTRRAIGWGFGVFNYLAGPEYVGVCPGLYGRTSRGRLVWFESVGDGRLDSTNHAFLIGTSGWNIYSIWRS